MDKLHIINVFIEVAKWQSFTTASEKLGFSAPTITRAVAALETELGVKLFHRTTRQVRLTESGINFLHDTTRILDDLKAAEAAVKGIYIKPSGTLSITAPILFGEKHVMPVITEYLHANPDVSVNAMYHDRITNLVEEGLDIAIRIGHLKDSSLYAICVGYVHRIVCGSPQYFEEHGEPSQPADLAQHSIIFPTTFEHSYHWSFQHAGKKEVIKLKPRLSCNQNASALKAAILGHGITRLMSYQIGEEIETGTLKPVLQAYEEPPLPVHIIHLEGHQTNAKTRSFINLAAELLRNNPVINPRDC